jgi:cytoskeletal protein CcmA (bactofilin family)
VELQATASVTGNIHTPRIAVMEGGKVSGEVRIQEPVAAEQPEISGKIV